MTTGPEDWEAQEPPRDFADRVMERVARERAVAVIEPRRRASLGVRITGGLALVAAVALAIGTYAHRASDHGDAVARERTEVHLGSRAIAVLERGAHVSWNGDEVNQPAGEVFYRVEPGSVFDVHTPTGDVRVLGTCFRVRVEGGQKEQEPMNGRDVKAGVLGAALSAAAFVSVYEGKVALSHAGERVTLTAGQTGRADGTGVTRGPGASGESSGAAEESSDPLVAANANLADSVREYKRRLEALEGQKASIAKQLTDAQQKLALAQNDGQAAPQKSDYDLSPDDWKEMAHEGKVVSRIPCSDPASWTPSASLLAKEGLAPNDAQPIHDVLQQSAQRVWSVIRPLCVQALQGDAKIADKLGVQTCTSLVNDVAHVNNENTEEELRAVADMRAGLRPYDAAALGTYGQILYAESGESKAMEQQLAQSIGPADAHSFVYGDYGCWSNNSSSVGPRPTLPPGAENGQKVTTGERFGQ